MRTQHARASGSSARHGWWATSLSNSGFIHPDERFRHLANYMYAALAALVDLHGFVVRDEQWEIPVEAQVLGFMRVDVPTKSGQYIIDLPVVPQGTLNDVDQDGQTDQGLQIFVTAYWPNSLGGPHSEGDDRSRGWPAYLASVKTDSENQGRKWLAASW
ncbi:MAG: hypothetical protein U5O69_09055 [Candidatus Competibacteraceae bacterium]|nr:hypothetical protein [Candidatus Competibacteraceae bacterium]